MSNEKDEKAEPNFFLPISFVKYILFFPAERITPDDIQRVARRFLSSAPALAARGQVQGLPSIKDVQAGLLHNQGLLPGKRLSLFR